MWVDVLVPFGEPMNWVGLDKPYSFREAQYFLDGTAASLSFRENGERFAFCICLRAELHMRTRMSSVIGLESDLEVKT
jgi:hypothetical protein